MSLFIRDEEQSIKDLGEVVREILLSGGEMGMQEIRDKLVERGTPRSINDVGGAQ